ncbi:MAG TPA: A/G-specific adenine glycosylase [Candidatus Faecousia intestinigallinarum]|nr:A/G-specific adenine glycosylase [Candidatus Faecousia intestinigallinarum]
MEENIYALLPGALLPWYGEHKRDLPWRQDKDPYHVWLSEIMLQQTRVEAVKGYYARFLSALPNVRSLALAEEEQLHKLWEGLGYYTRVRNLKKAAQAVCRDYGGTFPKEYAQVLALPGIGEYTAGAICSIAFDQPIPAVDGNVLRVCARLTDSSRPIDDPAYKKEIRRALAEIYPRQAGDFTQALMELGATVCGPNRPPECENCPCKAFCQGRRSGRAAGLPVKSPKRSKRLAQKTVFVFCAHGRYALNRRPDKGLLAGLWEFPNCDGFLEPEQALAWAAEKLHPRDIRRQMERKHIFTHIQWDMRCYYIDVSEPGGAFSWFTAEQIDHQAALPTAFRQFWEERHV